MIENISISQFWRELKAMPKGQRFNFIFPNKSEIRLLERVETINTVTTRENGVLVWLNKPKKDTVLKEDNKYILKDYLVDGTLIIEVLK